MRVLRSFGSAALLVVLILCTLPTLATTPNTTAKMPASRHIVEPQRNPDAACIQCHKEQKDELHGKHAGAVNPNTQLALTCTNCHGQASVLHRNGIKDVMRFNRDMFNADKAMYSVSQQNSVCMSCHLPEKLREAFWPHDVHMLKLSCVSCHQLHPKTDPMHDLDDKGRVKLCVDCHRRQQELISKETP
ncbi:cytochrome c nitrite reductase pentaheme subunit [Yersinia sp. 1652 StPb PI]|uniref:cytochrome c nitrite reductase pentaheme subunit n=1 Tax=unclassified Yersinia (in: enterobacteria) TaxID=2653513 RepID=UPI00355C38A7